MRIIYISTTCPYADAIEDFFLPEIKALMNAGHDVLVIPRIAGRFIEEENKVFLKYALYKRMFSFCMIGPVIRFMFIRPGVVFGLLKVIFSDRRALNIIKNLLVFPKGAWIAKVARDWRADHIHAQWATTNATMAFVAAALGNVEWSFTAHRGDIVCNNLLTVKSRSSKFVRFISESGIELARSVAAGIPSEKIRLIHMGVEAPAEVINISSSKPVNAILCPASLLLVKGHKFLIEAMDILRKRGVDCMLYLAGDGPLRRGLENQVNESGLSDRVVFLGHIAHGALIDMYKNRKVSIVVMPSVDLGGGLHEGIPVALMEAMSFGLPVVATSTGGIAELINRDCGMLVPPADPLALSVALESLLKDDKLWIRLAASGRQKIIQDFSANSAALALARNMG